MRKKAKRKINKKEFLKKTGLRKKIGAMRGGSMFRGF